MRARAERHDLSSRLAEAQARVARLELALRAEAERDAVTGLASLVRLRRALDIECERAQRRNQPMSVAVLDIDNFRRINARLQHSGGDEALRAVGDTVRQLAQPGDLAARTGSDEFALMMVGATLAEAEARCQGLMMALESTRACGERGAITVSAGVAERTPRQPAAGRLW